MSVLTNLKKHSPMTITQLCAETGKSREDIVSELATLQTSGAVGVTDLHGWTVFHPVAEKDAPFDGPEAETHAPRLGKQMKKVFDIMQDGKWRTIQEISAVTEAPENSISARLRDLRKPKHGGYAVVRRRREGNLYEYRLIADKEEIIKERVNLLIHFLLQRPGKLHPFLDIETMTGLKDIPSLIRFARLYRYGRHRIVEKSESAAALNPVHIHKKKLACEIVPGDLIYIKEAKERGHDPIRPVTRVEEDSHCYVIIHFDGGKLRCPIEHQQEFVE